MSKKEIIRKLSSRKFWVCVCGFVSSVMAMMRYEESEVALVTSLITGAGCLIAYILSEGYVDGASAGNGQVYPGDEELSWNGEDGTEYGDEYGDEFEDEFEDEETDPFKYENA